MKENNFLVKKMKEVNREEYLHALKDELEYINKVCHEQNIKYFLYYGTLIGTVRHKGMIPWDDDVDIAMPRNDYEKFLEFCRTNDTGIYTIVNNETDSSASHLISRLSDTRYHIDFMHSKSYEIGIFVDIYPLDGMGNNKFVFKIHGMLCHIFQKLFVIRFGIYYPPKKYIKNFVLKCLRKIIWLKNKSTSGCILRKLAMLYKYEKSKYVGCPVWIDGGYKNRYLLREWFEKTEKAEFEGIKLDIPADYNEILKMIYGNYMKLPPVEKRTMQHFYKIYKI